MTGEPPPAGPDDERPLTAKGKKYSSIIGHLLASKLVAETKDRYR